MIKQGWRIYTAEGFLKVFNVELQATDLVGQVLPANGGTGIDTSGSTGISKVAAGTWSVSDLLLADLPDIATSKLLGRSTAGSGSPEELSLGAGLDLTAGVLSPTVDLEMPKVGTPTQYTLRDDFDTRGSSGVLDGTLVYVTSDVGAGTHHIQVAAGEGYIRVSNDQQAALKFCEWASVAGIEIPTPAAGFETTRFIGVEYNAGVPQVTVRTAFDWNWYDDFPLARVSYDGTTLRILNAYAHSEDTANMTRRFLRLTMPFQREESPEGTGGLVITDVATRQLAMSAGNLWHGFNRYVMNLVAAGTPFDSHYRKAGGGFVSTVGITQWPNTQYDDGTGTLNTLGANKYACLWVYLDAADNSLDIVYGRGTYNSITNAQEEAVPASTPEHLQYHGRLLGRLIFKKSDDVASSVESIWTNNFTGAPIVTHEGLPDLQGGTSGEHYHLTSAEYSNLIPKVKEPCMWCTITTLPAYTYNNGSSGVGATLTANAVGDLTIDSATLSVGERLLVHLEGVYNGIYVVTVAPSPSTAFVFTRATDYDTPAKIDNSVVPILNGSLNRGMFYVCPYGPAAVGVNAFSLLPGVVNQTISQTLINKTLTSPVLNTGVSGTAIDTDTALTANSDTKLASQKAVKAHVAAAVGTLTSPVINTGVSGTAIDTDNTLAANSDTKLASQKAVKAHVATVSAAAAAAAVAAIDFTPYAEVAGETYSGEHNFSGGQLILPTDESSLAEAEASYDATRKLITFGDSQRDRGLSMNGWLPYVYPLGVNAANAFTATGYTLPANGGCVQIPITVPGHMLLASIQYVNVDVSVARTSGWDLYEMRLNGGADDAGELTGYRIAQSTANDTFTAAGASVRTLACADTYIPPGTYMLVIQNRHATSSFALGFIAAGTLNSAFNKNKTTSNPNGATLDLATSWTNNASVVGVKLRGKILGQSSAY